jgi:hypothetical protein
VAPSRNRSRQPQPRPACIYRHRNLIERRRARLKQLPAIAARYDKITTSQAAGSVIAAAVDWFKFSL